MPANNDQTTTTKVPNDRIRGAAAGAVFGFFLAYGWTAYFLIYYQANKMPGTIFFSMTLALFISSVGYGTYHGIRYPVECDLFKGCCRSSTDDTRPREGNIQQDSTEDPPPQLPAREPEEPTEQSPLIHTP